MKLPTPQRIASILEKFPNLMITKEGCPFCIKAKMLLDDLKISYKEILGTEDLELTKDFQDFYNYRMYPMVFLDKNFLKGYTNIKDLADNNQLYKYVKEQKSSNVL